jgi:hypothetical protein
MATVTTTLFGSPVEGSSAQLAWDNATGIASRFTFDCAAAASGPLVVSYIFAGVTHTQTVAKGTAGQSIAVPAGLTIANLTNRLGGSYLHFVGLTAIGFSHSPGP